MNENGVMGEMIEKPTPKCKVCKKYTHIELSQISDRRFWVCDNCHAVYEVLRIPDIKGK